jgi:hypothetical protein
LPDDAIPVVSAQWFSQDDALLRVAQGIRRIAERWRAGKTTVSAQIADTSTVSMPPPFEPSGREITQAIDDSGPGVIIDGKYFESDSVTEHDNGRFEVWIAPLSAEEDADLRALRPDQRRPARLAVSFAHGNEGFMAQVRVARSQSAAGRQLWIVELERVDTNRHLSQDMGVNDISADEIATMRARLLLLGEQPQPRDRGAESLITGFVGSVGQDRIVGSIFPELWIDSAGDLIKFLRFARLTAVFQLKTTNTCKEILELRIGPVADQQLHVRFRGRREASWTSIVTTIAVEGDCALELGSSEKKPPARRR